MYITQTAATGVDRRLRATGMQLETAVAFVGCLVALIADTQSLSLIPLVPQLEKEYSLSPSQASWALSALTLAGAAWIPTLTRLGDKLGMRRLVLVSLVLSVAGNLLCAVVHGFPLFVASRAILGLSASVPLIYAILRARSTSARRTNRGIGILTTGIGVGAGISFLISGVVIEANGSVRTVFWVMTALSVAALALTWWLLPDTQTRSADPVDWVGAAGISAGLFCIVLAITEGNTWHWSSGPVIGLFIAGAAIFAGWARYESRNPHPLINVRRVFNRTSAPAFIVGGLCGGIAIYANLAQVTYLEMPKQFVGYGLSLSVLQCAYILCATAAAAVAGGFLCAPVITRLGPGPVMAVAGAVTAADFFALAYAHDQIWQYVAANIVWGAAFSFGYAAAYAAFLQASRADEVAMYSSANSVFAAAIPALGPGIFAAVLTSHTIAHTPIPDPGVFRELWLYAAFAGIAILVLALVVRRPKFVPADPPADTADGLIKADGELQERPERA
jgi:MFS family permease